MKWPAVVEVTRRRSPTWAWRPPSWTGSKAASFSPHTTRVGAAGVGGKQGRVLQPPPAGGGLGHRGEGRARPRRGRGLPAGRRPLDLGGAIPVEHRRQRAGPRPIVEIGLFLLGRDLGEV